MVSLVDLGGMIQGDLIRLVGRSREGPSEEFAEAMANSLGRDQLRS